MVVDIVAARGAASEVDAGLVAPTFQAHREAGDPSATRAGHGACLCSMGGRCPRRDKLGAAKDVGGDDDSNSNIALEGSVIAGVAAGDWGPPAS